MTLYDTIKGKETYIRHLQENIASLRKKGFEVNGELPDLNEEVEGLLEEEPYRDNPIVQRMKNGEELEDIASEIIAQRKYGLKFNKKKREEYNGQVDNLCEVLPLWHKLSKETTPLKIGSVLSYGEPETFPFYVAAAYSLVMTGIGCLVPELREDLLGCSMLGGSIGILMGSFYSLTDCIVRRGQIKKQIPASVKKYSGEIREKLK